MLEPPPSHSRSLRLDRRRVLQLGAAGAATVALGSVERFGEVGTAEAAVLPPQLRRSTWLAVSDAAFLVDVDGGSVPWRLVDVTDLTIAEQIPALRNHDAAFALRFRGPAGTRQGTRTLHHAQLGTFDLFAVPVERAESTIYEAIVDRTVRIAGVNEEGMPTVSVPDARAEQPAPVAGATRPPAPGTHAPARASTVRPRLRTAVLVGSASRRIVLAELALADAAGVTSARARLLVGGQVVARTASTAVRRPQALRLRFVGRRALPRGRYELVLTLVGRDGRITRIRKHTRLS